MVISCRIITGRNKYFNALAAYPQPPNHKFRVRGIFFFISIFIKRVVLVILEVVKSLYFK